MAIRAEAASGARCDARSGTAVIKRRMLLRAPPRSSLTVGADGISLTLDARTFILRSAGADSTRMLRVAARTRGLLPDDPAMRMTRPTASRPTVHRGTTPRV